MSKKIGFIGTGNMGKAIISGILSANLVSSKEIVAYDSYKPALEAVHNKFGITITSSEREVVQQAKVIILAVKPNLIDKILSTIKEDMLEDKIIVSIAAGKTIDNLSKYLPENSKIIRVMPNTPALVGAGMSALCFNDYVTQEDKKEVLSIFESFGKAKIIDEYLIDAVAGVSGAGPAYVYIFIKSLADGAVEMGMSRTDAYTFAAQTVLGSAKMVLETGKHPGELKDMVTSPGGSTIAAIKSLENDKFRSTIINAVIAAAERNSKM